jgi:hypothetical protein
VYGLLLHAHRANFYWAALMPRTKKSLCTAYSHMHTGFLSHISTKPTPPPPFSQPLIRLALTCWCVCVKVHRRMCKSIRWKMYVYV